MAGNLHKEADRLLRIIAEQAPQAQASIGAIVSLMNDANIIDFSNQDVFKRWRSLAFYLERINEIVEKCQDDFDVIDLDESSINATSAIWW